MVLGTDANCRRLSDNRFSLTSNQWDETEDSMMMRHRMMWFCGAMMVIAVVLLVAGAGSVAFIAPLACVAMMAMMVLMMFGMGRRH